MIKPRLVLPLLAIIALAVTLAACGSGASTTPGGAGASAPTDTAKIVDGGILVGPRNAWDPETVTPLLAELIDPV